MACPRCKTGAVDVKRIVSFFLLFSLLSICCFATEEETPFVTASVSDGKAVLTAVFDNSENVFLALEDEDGRLVYVDALFEGRKQGKKSISLDVDSLDEGRYEFYAECGGKRYSAWFELEKSSADKEKPDAEDDGIPYDDILALSSHVLVEGKADKNNTLYVSESLVTKEAFEKLDKADSELTQALENNRHTYSGKEKKELVVKTAFLSNKTAAVVFESSLCDVLRDGYWLTVKAQDFCISFRTEDLKKELLDCKEGESLRVYAEDYSANQNKGKSFFFGKKRLVTKMRACFSASAVSGTASLVNYASNEKNVYKYNELQGFAEVILDKEACLAFERADVPFSDIHSIEASEKTAIDRLYAMGVLGNTKAREFYPDSSLTRSRLCEYAARLLCLKEEGEGFSDTVSESYDAYAKQLRLMGIMIGFDDGLFKGDESVTAEQLAAVSARVLRLCAGCCDVGDDESNEKAAGFADWAKEDAALCIREGIFTGEEAILKSPEKEISRGFAALVLVNLFDRL